MGLKKGQTNNPAGRPHGKPNKVTAELREWVQKLIDDNRKQLETDLKKLDPKDRWQVIEKLMSYVVPKMQSVEAKIDFSNFSENQIDTIVNELLTKVQDESPY